MNCSKNWHHKFSQLVTLGKEIEKSKLKGHLGCFPLINEKILTALLKKEFALDMVYVALLLRCRRVHHLLGTLQYERSWTTLNFIGKYHQ